MRILQEQRECRDYIVQQKGPDVAGAKMGLADWVMEEVLETSDYSRFLASKRKLHKAVGFTPNSLNESLYPFQEYTVEWALRLGRAAVFADCGCVAGETVINTPDGDCRIDELERAGRPFRVWALSPAGSPTVAYASAPFKKGRAMLYEVQLKSGRRIIVTAQHRFLSTHGWKFASQRDVGSQLAVSSLWKRQSADAHYPFSLPISFGGSHQCAVSAGGRVAQHAFSPGSARISAAGRGACERPLFAVSHPRSSGAPYQPTRSAGVHYSDQTPQGYMENYFVYLDPCDGQPQPESVGGPAAPPSQADVPLRSRSLLHGDEWACRPLHTHPCLHIGRPSMKDSPLLAYCADRDGGFPPASLQPRSRSYSLPDVEQFDSFATRKQSMSELCLCQSELGDVPSLPYFDTVSSIKYIRTDIYYDLHVPVFESYLANGIWNHNTGKTIMQLDWARAVSEHTDRPVLILAPLAVARQTEREGARFGIPVKVCRTQEHVRNGVNITNYEMLGHFDASAFSGVVLDESSILKSYTGKIRNAIIEAFGSTPFRLACTATPSPNDYMELGNHAEFLGVMTRTAMLSTYFNHDGGETSKWRLKGHAERPFWNDFVSSWAVMFRRPSDLGFSDAGYDLPELRRHIHTVRTDAQSGFLFPVEAGDLSERRESRKVSIEERVSRCVDVVLESWGVKYTGSLESICGNLNTLKPAERNTNLIQKSGCVDAIRPEPQKRTSSICAITTQRTKRNGTSAENAPHQKETQNDESDTPPIQNTELKSSTRPRFTAGLRPSAIPNSKETSESTPLDMTSYSKNKTGPVRSVDLAQQIQEDTDSTLTTVINQAGSAGCSAETAISQSANLGIAQRFYASQQSTSKPPAWVIWCDLNAEQKALERAFGSLAFSVSGSMPNDQKEYAITAWLNGERPILITKPSIAGWGLNMQFCHQMAFLGLSDSYESMYQAERRCWRFGQQHPVDVHIFVSDRDGAVLRNQERKRTQAIKMAESMMEAMKKHHA